MSATIPVTIILILYLAFLVFLMYLLLHGQHRRLLPVQLAASTILGHVPLALFHHPTSIQLKLRKLPITEACCWIMSFIEMFTEIIIPYTLMMFTIERLMYIRNPTGHAQKITKAATVILVVFPWLISSVVGIIDIGVLVNSVDVSHTFENTTYHYCYQNWRSTTAVYANMVLGHVFGGAIPFLINLIVTITVLVMWCCYKHKMSQGTDYSLMGEEIEACVRRSVIAVAVLNGLYIPVFVAEVSMGRFMILTFPFMGVFGIIEGIVWICTLVPVRAKFVALFERCCPTTIREQSVQHGTNDAPGIGPNPI